MDNKNVKFKESRIFQTSFLLVLMGSLCSVVPDGNWTLFSMNMGIAGICSVVFYLLWRRNRRHSKRYFSLLSYFMLVALAVYFAIPLFRVFIGSFIFWTALLVILVMAILPYFYSENIIIGVQNPTKTTLGKIYSITIPLIILFGTLLFFNANLSGNPQALPISVFLYFGAIFFLFIAPILLITPERVEELNRK
ncbi:hypothetical protein FGG79_20800 [Bacillus sp. BHET2]|uniref:hypothetical protein n=1 Tax=Bacillus sp. BHET2 TaxID=2583818 RepID=UPI00110E5DB4|nr:hypothetical protein [Bacillus sp. BHET2]TMU82723.1 hypothetical protein FGG79_20800 [Bacillus sp. BHET2]